MTTLDIAAGVLLGLAAARITAVLARRLWMAIASALVVSADPGMRLPAWFWLVAEIATGQDWRRAAPSGGQRRRQG